MLWAKMTLLVGITALGAAFTASALASPFHAASAPGAKPDPQPGAAKKQKEETPLEAVLRKWAEADAKISAMHVRFTATEQVRVFDTETVTSGYASIKKLDLWRVDRFDKERRKRGILLREGDRLHCFNTETKTEKIFRFPEAVKEDPPNGARPEWLESLRIDVDNSVNNLQEQFRWLSFGPRACDIDSRCVLRLSKQDKWYIYLDVAPHRKGQMWFDRGRIVLNRKDYQVRQVWVERPGLIREQVVDFFDRQTNPQEPITRDSLLKGLSKGWRREEE